MSRKLKKSWLDSYLEYVQDTEAPELYRLWCGISAISSALKRKVFVKRGMITIYPNQYVILVGPPGIGKGTGMNPATDIVKEANVAHYIEDRATAESIEDTLANGFAATGVVAQGISVMGIEHACTAIAPELSIFIGASDWMLQFLCTLWDKNEFSYGTKKSGTSIVKDNCFSLLAACTPDYIRKINRDTMAAVAGGFTSRSIFVYASKKAQTVAWPVSPPQDLKDALVNDLREIASKSGEFNWTQGAKDLFVAFINNIDKTAEDFESEVLVNFRARMWSHVVKNAMIFSISESDDMVIRESHFARSIKCVDEVFNSLDITFRGVGESTLTDATARIMAYLERKLRCSRTEILRANWRHITDEDLTRVLLSLCVMGFCVETTSGNHQYYTFTPSFYTQQAATATVKIKSMGAGTIS